MLTAIATPVLDPVERVASTASHTIKTAATVLVIVTVELGMSTKEVLVVVEGPVISSWTTGISDVSMSVKTLADITLAIRSPTTTVRALVPSCIRTIVRTSPTIAVTRTISALTMDAVDPVGQMVQLNGGVGNRAPWPAVTVRLVPVVAGDGATATALTAKFLWAS
jgi:hypothetical protein